jgi:MYXO-CTERM domain-containing protein
VASQDGVKEATRLIVQINLLSAQEKYDEALPLAERVLSLVENAFGLEHRAVAAALSNLAGLHTKKGDYGQAEPLYLRALAINEKALGPEHSGFATSLHNLAELYRRKGDAGRAEPLFLRALPIQEKALGPEHLTVAITLDSLAALYRVRGDAGRAEPLFLRVLSIREMAFGPEHPSIITSLNSLAELYRGKGDYGRAEPLYRRALSIGEKARGPDHPDVAMSLNNLAVMYQEKGDPGRAEPLLLRALAIHEKARGPEHPDVATSLNNLAELYHRKGDYGRARPLYLRSLSIREKARGSEHPDVATTLHNLGGLYRDMGDAGRAEPLLLRALAIWEKALGPDHPHVAVTLDSLGGLHRRKGDYGRAEPLLLRALAIKEKALGREHPSVATTLNDLAELYRDKGDHGRAAPLYQRALSIGEKALGPNHPFVATFLSNLAGMYEAKGDAGQAERLYQRALAITETVLGPAHPDVATLLSNLAGVYVAKGDAEQAERLYKQALSIREKALGPDHSDIASTLNNLAAVSRSRGEALRAELLYQRALTLWEKALGPDHPTVAAVLSNLAFLYAADSRVAQAVNAAQRGADIRDRNAAAVLATGSEEQKRLYMATLEGETFMALSLHLQIAPADPAAARLALTHLLRRKGRVLDSMTDSLAALRRTLAPGGQGLLDQLASVYTQLATQVSRGPGTTPPGQYRKNLAALEQEREKLEADLGRRSGAFRAQQRLLRLPDVQAALPEGAALVEIALYTPFSLRSNRFAGDRGAPRYVAYVVRREGEPVFADLGEAAAVDAAAANLRRALGDHDLRHDPKPAARALDALLMQPVRKLLGDSRWVFVSPDGPLSLISLGALVDEQGHFLVERYLFSTLTSGRDLLRFQAERAAPRQAPLVLANPAFEDPSAVAAPDATHRGVRSIDMNLKATPLTNTVEEARAIARLFPDARVLLGTQATEGAVKGARAPRFLHLATHGFFLPEMPLPKALLAGPGGQPTPAERAAIAQRENPLLRSGIALAGFNRRQSGADDGVLTALEAAEMDLVGTQLVVLSACESGLGQAVTGEGVVGLRRTLSMAGAETQVMSLWEVDTGRTRELMIAYYEGLKAGVGRSEAMRDVQLAMLADAKTAHPNLWASFVVSGDWRTLSGQARLPKVTPGSRGCSCEQAGGEGSARGAWLSLALVGAAAARRRRFAAPCSRRSSSTGSSPPPPSRASNRASAGPGERGPSSS